MNKKLIIHAIFFLLIFSIGCKGKSYVFTLDSYPPGSKPHENNWSHILKIVMYQNHSGGFNRNGEKEINIYIEDNQENILFEDQFKIITGAIDREVKWSEFEKILCKLFTFKTEGTGKSFKRINKNYIAELKFEYNHEKKMFEKKVFNILK